MKYPYSEMLTLPPLELVDRKPKRPVGDVDTSTLTGTQLEHFNEIKRYMLNEHNDEYDFILLEGYAGTGKTYLTSMITEWILRNTDHKVAVTAPTNKAVKVIKDAGSYFDPNLEYSTIHSLLGLREQITGYGKQIFVQNKKEDARIGEYTMLEIDEVSMLPDDLTLGAQQITGIFEYSQMLNLKILFVGDPCQIPPIGKDQSIVLTEEFQEKFRIKVLKLTEIVRQSAGNPIIALTLGIREALGRAVVLPLRESQFDPETFHGVFFMDGNDLPEFNALLKHYFTSENFRDDANFCKIVAYRNNTVNAFNKKVRRMIYGKDAGKICIGEKLIANKPIMDGDEVAKFTTNDEFEVQSFTVTTGDYKGAELIYYTAIVTAITATGIKTEEIKIIHEDSEDDFKLILNHLVELAEAEKKGSWEAAAKWKDFYAIQKVFADINYNYAITGHKSQGSTYTNCFLMESDMDVNNKIRERNRIKYTVGARPTDRLFVLE